jgi:hypothetical protein
MALTSLKIPEHNCGPQIKKLRSVIFPNRTLSTFLLLQTIISPLTPLQLLKKTKITLLLTTHTTSSSTLSTTQIFSPPQPLFYSSNHFSSPSPTLLLSPNPRCGFYTKSTVSKPPFSLIGVKNFKSHKLAPIFAIRNPKTTVR